MESVSSISPGGNIKPEHRDISALLNQLKRERYEAIQDEHDPIKLYSTLSENREEFYLMIEREAIPKIESDIEYMITKNWIEAPESLHCCAILASNTNPRDFNLIKLHYCLKKKENISEYAYSDNYNVRTILSPIQGKPSVHNSIPSDKDSIWAGNIFLSDTQIKSDKHIKTRMYFYSNKNDYLFLPFFI